MKLRTILKDIPSGKDYDLTSLVKEHEEITIGRAGAKKGCLIELGEGISTENLEGKTKAQQIGKLKSIQTIPTISGHHATITYRYGSMDGAWAGKGFYLHDHSTNGTRLGENGEVYKWNEQGLKLIQVDEFYFGGYGPVKVETVEIQERKPNPQVSNQ